MRLNVIEIEFEPDVMHGWVKIIKNIFVHILPQSNILVHTKWTRVPVDQGVLDIICSAVVWFGCTFDLINREAVN